MSLSEELLSHLDRVPLRSPHSIGVKEAEKPVNFMRLEVKGCKVRCEVV